MPPADDAPAFPPSAFVEKVIELGFGSGPWTRRDLEERWGSSSANRFVADGKRFGWLLSPYQNTFYLPPARDLTIASWLPSENRAELGIARALASAGVPAWCLSAWLEEAGLDIGLPLFVTDLGASLDQPPPTRRGLPFPENLVVVPRMPPLRAPWVVRTVRLPRGKPKRIPPGASALATAGQETLALGPEEPSFEGPAEAEDPRVLRFAVSPSVSDPAWMVALAASLALPRVEERLRDIGRFAFQADTKRRAVKGMSRAANVATFKQRVLNWLGSFGPPAPNTAWKGLGDGKAAPYLLVPEALWREVAAGTFARRYEDVGSLGLGG